MKLKLIIQALFICFFVSISAGATQFGKTYPIQEKDALLEIQEHAKKVDWDKAINKDKIKNKIENFKPSDLQNLPRATKNNKRLVDMSYVSEFDIRDKNGSIIYPKGYKFNPLDYINYPKILVIINGNDKEQADWFEKSVYFKQYKVNLLLSNGHYMSLIKKWNRPVFYLSKKIVERLKLKVVPSIVKQNGKFMQVEEISIKEKK